MTYLRQGYVVGALTLERKLPIRVDDHSRFWVCVCSCGTRCEKSAVVLRDRKVTHRCTDCYIKSQRAHANLLRMFGGK